ncbi:MAG: Rqc2 family fibronectin-binding protein [Cellulosilyticaceae bacterium]
MALDGVVLSNIVHELNSTLIGGRIDKIYQPEKEEMIFTIRSGRENFRLLLTANSSYPRIHFTEKTKASPASPPMFCMLLRKHLISGKILAIHQPDFERIVRIDLEAQNELGDKEAKCLIIEIMGRHSNIILTKKDGTIIDSIKHISLDKSSVRAILPGKNYTAPPSQNKHNPLLVDETMFKSYLLKENTPFPKVLYTTFSGLSPLISTELSLPLGDTNDLTPNDLSSSQWKLLWDNFYNLILRIKNGNFSPIIYKTTDGDPVDFYSVPLSLFPDKTATPFTSISSLLENYYFDRSTHFIVSQKTSDIKKIITTFIDRAKRKQTLQQKAITESHNCAQDKIYGELLTAYSYSVPAGSTVFTTTNYYKEPYETMDIPLDPLLSAIENAQRYFKRYNKSKRTLVAATAQLKVIEEDLNYLNSVLTSLDFLETPEDILGLRQELVDMGYLKKRKQKGPKPQKNAIPYMRFKSTTGVMIYVGKNNYQNDELTMKFANSRDLWLHIKDGPGSHVIVRLDNQTVDDTTLIEAAQIAAYYSNAKHGSNVAIDYTEKKNVKKIPGAKPGLVTYQNFKTIYVTPTMHFVKSLSVEK